MRIWPCPIVQPFRNNLGHLTNGIEKIMDPPLIGELWCIMFGKSFISEISEFSCFILDENNQDMVMILFIVFKQHKQLYPEDPSNSCL